MTTFIKFLTPILLLAPVVVSAHDVTSTPWNGGWGMMPWGWNGMMGGCGWGWGFWGWAMFLAWLVWLVVGILAAVWLWKLIQKHKGQ